MNIESFIHERYEIKNCLGSGSYGAVYKAHDRKYNKDIAIKCVESSRDRKLSKYTENKIMKILRQQGLVLQKYVVQMHDFFIIDGYRCYVLELLHCDLIQALHKHYPDGFDIKLIASIGFQLLTALSYIQNLKLGGVGKTSLIHNDLKLDNIMFTDDTFMNIKIIDFGLSTFRFEGNSKFEQNTSRRAPEGIFLTHSEVTPAADVWSVGVILFSIFANKNMFESDSVVQQAANLVNAFGEPSLEMLEGERMLTLLFDRSGDQLKLKSKILEKANNLKSFRDMFQEAAIAAFNRDPYSILYEDEFYDLLLKIFEMDPKLRITPQSALQHSFFELLKKEYY